jgi:hypothetical protein
MRIKLLLPLLVVLATVLPMPVSAAPAVKTLYESYNTWGGANVSVYGGLWRVQTFTTDANVAHSLSEIKLSLKRTGLPGYIYCSLRETSSGGDLFTYTIDGDTISSTEYQWISFYPTARYSLEANHQYSLVLRAPTGTATAFMDWAVTAAGGVAGGNEFYSTDSGLTWNDEAPKDCLYEIWGYPTLNVINANVFSDYLETGDWMIMVSMDCTLAPYVNQNVDAGSYVIVELVNSTGVVVASSPVKYWDRQPIGIYLSAATATGQTWDGIYSIRIKDISGTPYVSYSLISTDWRGSNKAYIDSWMRLQAQDYQSYYLSTLLVATSTTAGDVLNDTGKVMFVRGIPQIDVVRPLMFQSSIMSTPYPAQIHPKAYEVSRDYHAELGVPLSNMLENFALVATGNTTTDNVKTVGTWGLVGGYLVLALVATSSISAWAGIALGVPIILLGAFFGIVSLSALGAIGSIMGFLIIYQWIWGKA